MFTPFFQKQSTDFFTINQSIEKHGFIEQNHAENNP